MFRKSLMAKEILPVNDEFKRAWGKDFRNWEVGRGLKKEGVNRVRRRVTIWIPGLLVVIGGIGNRDEEPMRLALMVLRQRGVKLSVGQTCEGGLRA